MEPAQKIDLSKKIERCMALYVIVYYYSTFIHCTNSDFLIA